MTGLKTNPLPETPHWLRVDMKSKAEQIDRDKGIIRGVILAEEGPFKDLRGEFDRPAIRRVVALAKERTKGLKARLGHPSASSDSIGKYLGRYHNHRTDTVLREVGKGPDGKPLLKEMLVAKGDLHFDQTALEEPIGGGKPLGVYLMDLAESDEEAFGASLVLKREEKYRVDKQNRRLMDEKGEELPPLWMPTVLHACDCVDDGDATHSFLSSNDGLPVEIVRQGCQLLDAQFPTQDRNVIKARLSSFVDRYLSYRFGDEDEQLESPPVEVVGSLDAELVTTTTVEPTADVPQSASDDALVLGLWLAVEE